MPSGADTVSGGDTTSGGADTVASGSDTLPGDTTSGSGDSTEAGSGADSIPESYAAPALPDGMQVDDALLGEFGPIAKELGLSQDKFDKVVGFYADKVAARQAAQWTETVDGWATATKADPDIGGPKFNDTVTAAGKALDKFGTPELRAALDTSGLGSHPEVVRFVAAIGRAISEDTFVTGKEAAGPSDHASILYG